MGCPTCCSSCMIRVCQNTPEYNSPFSLRNFLPAGTIRVPLRPDTQPACEHIHAQDDWHHFRPQTFLQHLTSDENVFLCQDIDFLVQKLFLAATFRCIGPATRMELTIRIYIIPWDLLGVQGALRNRTEDVLSPARRHFRSLLPKIEQDPSAWWCDESPSQSTNFLSEDNDGRSMAEIYSDLSSPRTDDLPDNIKLFRHILDPTDDLKSLGLRSELYQYQRESVVAMMKRELDKRDIPDPLFISISGIDGKLFYFQPAVLEILSTKPMIAPTRGGVLCEELGTGKTVMTLTLILATLHQLPSPEEHILDTRPVLTPLAFRHFPSSDFVNARRRAFRDKTKAHFPCEPRVPSLFELLLHHTRVFPQNQEQYEERLETTNKAELLRANVPFYHHYDIELPVKNRTKRRNSHHGPRTMLLSTATLIVVPGNLITQWSHEVNKHIRYPLKVLLLRRKTPTPSLKVLASDYDIILMTYNRFSAEASKNDIGQLRSWDVCTCAEFPGSRVPKCECPDNTRVSFLLQIRWKRIVIDEGHVSGTTSTSLDHFAKLLSIERRWIVTGTPTTNLLGLSFGKNNDETDNETEESESRAQSLGPTISEDTNSLRKFGRIWTKYDREDLRKLSTMISHFIGVPHFSTDSKLFKTRVSDPLCDAAGPRLGSIRVLEQVMDMVMIRHRIEDVEKDVVLPPIKQETILLDLDNYAIKSYNALQAVIAINAVDSQRTDQDYMFHARNSEFLRRTVGNMSQLMFWRVDDGLYNVDQLCHDSQEHIDTAISRNVDAVDLEMMHDAFAHLRSAAADPLWRALQAHENVSYRVLGMDKKIFEAFTRTPLPPLNPSITGFMHSDRLRALCDIVSARPLIRGGELILKGIEIAKDDEERRLALQESLSKRNRRGKEDSSSEKRKFSAHSVKPTDKVKEVRAELQRALEKIAADQNDDRDDQEDGSSAAPVAASHSISSHIPRSNVTSSALLASSPLTQIRIGNSVSTKLDYILNEVQRYSQDEKFLIFSESALSLAYVADGLDLMHINYLDLATAREPQVREQYVTTFETSDTYRVFLLELKHGARGLNLISASRVIFCEPVWRPDVESQAIKRAHRIGQTKPISVKTLAIRDTAEQNMVARRDALKEKKEKVLNMTEDEGMIHYIKNPKFIINSPMRATTLDIPLIPLAPLSNINQTEELSASVIQVGSSSLRPEFNLREEEEESDEQEKEDHFVKETMAAASSSIVRIVQPVSIRLVRAEEEEEEEQRPAKRTKRVMFADRMR